MWWIIQKWLDAERFNLATEIIHWWVHNLMALLAGDCIKGWASQRKLVIEGVSQKVKSCPAFFLTLLSHHGLTDFATEHAHHHDAVSSLMETGDYDWNLSDTCPQINPSWFWACISQVFGTQMKGLPRTLWINTIYMNLTAFFKPLHLSFNLGEKKGTLDPGCDYDNISLTLLFVKLFLNVACFCTQKCTLILYWLYFYDLFLNQITLLLAHVLK